MITATFALNDTEFITDLLIEHEMMVIGSGKFVTYLQSYHSDSEEAVALFQKLRDQKIPIALTKIGKM